MAPITDVRTMKRRAVEMANMYADEMEARRDELIAVKNCRAALLRARCAQTAREIANMINGLPEG